MKAPKLIVLLLQLNAKEIDDFLLFVRSPYFNTHKEVIRLVELLVSQYPHLSTDRNQLAELFYPNNPKAYQNLADVMTYTLRLARKFLTVEQLGKDESTQSLLCIESLAQHGLEKLQEQSCKKLLNDPHAHNSVDSHYHRYKLNESLLVQAARKQQRTDGQYFVEMLSHLDQYYLLNRLRYACAAINRQEVLDSKINLEVVERLFPYIQKTSERNTLLQLYHKTFLLLRSPEQVHHFEDLRSILELQSERIPIENTKELYAYLMNYCIRRMNAGQNVFREILMELYRQQLSRGLLFEEGYLSHWNYKNIVSLGIILEEFDWTKAFLESHQTTLRPAYQKNAYSYNLAALMLAQSRYSEVLRLLQKVKFEDIYYQIGAKIMLIKVFYAQLDIDPLYSQLDSLQLLIKRKDQGLSRYQKGLYGNFIKLMRKLVRLRLRFKVGIQAVSTKQVAKLRTNIKEKGAIAQKKWLLDQLTDFLQLMN